MDAKMMLESFKRFEEEKNIPKEIVIEALKEALEKAYKKSINEQDALCEVIIDDEKGIIDMYEVKNIVENVEDDLFEMDLEDAKQINKDAQIGETVRTGKIDTDELTRLAARQALQVFLQKIREYEKRAEYEPYIEKVGEIINGVVEQIGSRNTSGIPEFISINLGKTKAILRSEHIIPGEELKQGEIVKVYVVDVDKNAKGAPVIVSRTHSGFLKRLFESEIPEIYDGTIEIVHIVRQPGVKSKVSVISRNKNVDPTGACIGPKGIRIQKISNMLMNEKIDVINYYEDPILYIYEALKPASVIGVRIEEEDLNSEDEKLRKAIAIVKDEEYSLAIGKKGINAKLAVRMSGFSLDIITESEAVEKELQYEFVEEKKELFEEEKRKEEEEKRVKRTRKVVVQKQETKELQTGEKIVENKIEEQKEIKPTPALDEQRLKELVKLTEKPKVKPKPKKQFNDEKEEKRVIPITSKKVEELKKKHEEARSQMPVYDEEDLKDLDDSNDNDPYYSGDDFEFEDFDDYYNED